MPFFRHVVLLIGVLCIARQAESAELQLQVAGRLRAAICQANFGAQGQADFGAVLRASFTPGQRLLLAGREIPFTIVCDTPMRVGLTPRDNRGHSADGGVSEALGVGVEEKALAADIFGLGYDGARPLGGYEIRFVRQTLRGDGRPIDAIAAMPHGWSRRDGALVRSGVVNAWAEPGAKAPGAFRRITGSLQVRPVLNALEAPDALTQDISIDGSLTLELTYL